VRTLIDVVMLKPKARIQAAEPGDGFLRMAETSANKQERTPGRKAEFLECLCIRRSEHICVRKNHRRSVES
jgi:hypothetical protein